MGTEASLHMDFDSRLGLPDIGFMKCPAHRKLIDLLRPNTSPVLTLLVVWVAVVVIIPCAAQVPPSRPANGPSGQNSNGVTPRILDSVRIASRYPGADAGSRIAAAIADLPATGGTVDARGLDGNQSINADFFSGVKKPVVLVLGFVTITANAAVRIGGSNNNQWIMGQGARATVWQASSSFPASAPLISVGKSDGTFSSGIVGVDLIGSNKANVCLDFDGAQEGSFAQHVQTHGCTLFGVRFHSNSSFAPGSTQNTGIRDSEINVAGTSGIGIYISNGDAAGRGATGRIFASNLTVNNDANDGRSSGAGIDIEAATAFVYIENIHCERYAECILKNGAATLSVVGANGSSNGVNSVLRIAAGRFGYTAIEINANGATYALDDQNHNFRSRYVSWYTSDGGDHPWVCGDAANCIFSSPGNVNYGQLLVESNNGPSSSISFGTDRSKEDNRFWQIGANYSNSGDLDFLTGTNNADAPTSLAGYFDHLKNFHTVGSVSASAGGAAGTLVCWMADGKQLGHCASELSGTPPSCKCSQ
jgi:hypothetical protein